MQYSDNFHSYLLLSNVFPHPAEYDFMPAFAVERSKNPMAFIRKNQSLGWHAITAERGEELKALIHRHTKIVLISNNQRWSFDFVREQMWRASGEMPSRRGTPGRTAGFPVGKPEFFALERHGFEVENTIVGDGGLETVRVSDEPIDRISSVARARDTHSLWIDESEPRHRIENGIEVNHDLAAPILRDFIHESLPETRRTARVRRCNNPTSRSPKRGIPAIRPRVRPIALRAAVNEENGRILFRSVEVRR